MGLLLKLFRGKVLQKYEIEVPALERHLGEIRDFITPICNDAGFSQHEINNIKLALDEACSNVVRHAYKDMTPGNIHVDVFRRAKEVEINILDQGKSFAWKKAKTPDLNRYVEIGKRGGLGVWFIRKLMDEADYKTSHRGNTLYLIKRVKSLAGMASGSEPRLPTFPLPEKALPIPRRRGMSRIGIKYLLPAMGSVAVLVLLIFAYMFSNQSQAMRLEIMGNTQEKTRRLAADAENYLLKQNDLQLARLVKTMVKTDDKLAYAMVLDNQDFIWAHSITAKMFTKYAPPLGFKRITGREPMIQKVADPSHNLIHDIAYPIVVGDLRLGAVHVGILEKLIERDIRTGRRSAILIFIIALAVGTSGAYFLMTFLIAPIRKLTDGMLAVSSGRLDHQIVIHSNDEFGQIANVFNEMTLRFRDAQKNLLEQERIQQEMQVAQEIQHTLLPRELPKIEGYDVASLYRSAKEVGGDYFDFVWVDDNTLGIAVADVSGKGIPGSLVMTMIRTALRLEARSNNSAADVLVKVNEFVTRDMKKGMFVTMFYIILNSRKRIINYASAGHNPMILYRKENDNVYYLKPRGFPLGIDLPDPALFAKSMTQESVQLKKGDLLLSYTDGITEAMNPRREQFGEQRLIDFIRKNQEFSAEEFIAKLSEDIALFTENYPQNDDITCVVVKEGMQADDVQFNIRRKLFYLIEEQGISVKEACAHMNISTTTYYRLKKIRDKHGIRALRDDLNTKDAQMRQISVDERQKLLSLIVAQPDWSARRLAEALAAQFGESRIAAPVVYQELKRLHLASREEREVFAQKKKVD